MFGDRHVNILFEEVEVVSVFSEVDPFLSSCCSQPSDGIPRGCLLWNPVHWHWWAQEPTGRVLM